MPHPTDTCVCKAPRSVSLIQAGQFFGPVKATRKSKTYCFTTLSHPRGFDIPEHAHDWPFVTFFLSGNYRTNTLFSAHETTGNAALFFPPWYQHSDGYGDQGAKLFCLQLHPNWLETTPMAPTRERDLIDIQNSQAMLTLHRLLLGMLDDTSSLDMECLIAECLSHIFEPRPKSLGPDKIRRVRDRLMANDIETPNLETLASLVDVHKSTLARQFRRHFGVSIGAYRQTLRRLQAIDMIAGGSLSLAEISCEANYADQSHMTRDVRKAFSASPSELRMKIQNHFK